MTRYPVAERFKSVQGEGLYTGTPMAFIRFVGCSVGKKVCNLCDTDFDLMDDSKGGGLYDIDELVKWTDSHRHVCLTGGEPLDRALGDLILTLYPRHLMHIETSGTVAPKWLDHIRSSMWLTVSPKPGYKEEMIDRADELKIILGGLGDGPGWPTLDDALRWAEENPGRPVYVQPANNVDELDMNQVRRVERLVNEYPILRLSVQLHKFLGAR